MSILVPVVVVLLVAFVVLVVRSGRAGGVRRAGQDGSSPEKAIVIENSVREEYEHLATDYPGAVRHSQSVVQRGTRVYDVLEFATPDGVKRTIFFDITAFYGK